MNEYKKRDNKKGSKKRSEKGMDQISTINPNNPGGYYANEHDNTIRELLGRQLSGAFSVGSHVEVEARLGLYTNDFEAKVKPRDFLRLLNYYLPMNNVTGVRIPRVGRYEHVNSRDRSLGVYNVIDVSNINLTYGFQPSMSSGLLYTLGSIKEQTNLSTNAVTYQLKTHAKYIQGNDNNFGHIELPDYQVRIALNQELITTYDSLLKNTNIFIVTGGKGQIGTSITLFDTLDKLTELFNEYSHIRQKDRHSLILDSYRIDFTIVTNKDGRKNYEIEIEYNNNLNSDFMQFKVGLHELIKRWQDTYIVYTNSMKMGIMDAVNKILEGKVRYGIDKDSLTEARNLHLKDLVDGALIGLKSERYMNEWRRYYKNGLFNSAVEEYIVSHKVDGFRKLLVIDPERGVWLISAPDSANFVQEARIIPSKFRGPIMERYWYTAKGGMTILECELVPMESRVKGVNLISNEITTDTITYYLEAHDCLAYMGENKIQGLYYFLRKGAVINCLQNEPKDLPKDIHEQFEWVDNKDQGDFLKNNLICVFAKMHYAFSNMQTFYDSVNKLLNDQNQSLIPYKTDGLIFTPGFTPYNPYNPQKSSLKLPPLDAYDRTLAHFPEVCKWKPKISIDFLIEIIPPSSSSSPSSPLFVKLLSHRGGTDQHEIFRGSRYSPFVGVQQWHSQLSAVDGIIYEFEYDERLGFVAIRPRSDKPSANNTDVAEDNWKMIQRPITVDTLRGHSFELVTQYHKEVKDYLYRKIPSGDGNQVLLDIGTGHGGDLHKWKAKGVLRFKKVIMVENDVNKIPELFRRLELNEYFDYRDKVILVVRVNGEPIAFDPFTDVWTNYIQPVGGEDYEAISHVVNNILKVKVDVVTMMLSMSFFWESAEKLSNLTKTILNTCNNNAKLYYLTLDRDLVLQAFKPPNGVGIYSGWTNVEGLNIHPNDGRLILYKEGMNEAYMKMVISPTTKDIHLLTHIPKTIVSRDDAEIQKEWLPRITDLIKRIPGSKQFIYGRTDKRSFLSPGEQIFTLFFSYGIINLHISRPIPLPKSVTSTSTTKDDNPKSMFLNYLASIQSITYPMLPTDAPTPQPARQFPAPSQPPPPVIPGYNPPGTTIVPVATPYSSQLSPIQQTILPPSAAAATFPSMGSIQQFPSQPSSQFSSQPMMQPQQFPAQSSLASLPSPSQPMMQPQGFPIQNQPSYPSQSMMQPQGFPMMNPPSQQFSGQPTMQPQGFPVQNPPTQQFSGQPSLGGPQFQQFPSQTQSAAPNFPVWSGK